MNNELLNLAFQTKEAAVNTSGTQVLPYQITPSAANGLYDPSDANALYSRLSQARVQANEQRVLGGDTNPGNSGTDLIPYAGVLNQGYGTVNWATTTAQSPLGKAANTQEPVYAADVFTKAASAVAELGYDPYTISAEELESIENQIANAPSQDAWDTGIFEDEALVPTEAEHDQIVANAEKSASEIVRNLTIGMANEGILDLPEFNDGNPYVAHYIAGRVTGQI